MGNHIAAISWKYRYVKSITSFAGTMKSFAGMAFWTNIKRKIESSYQPVDLLSISLNSLPFLKTGLEIYQAISKELYASRNVLNWKVQ